MIEINYNEYKETIADNMKLIQENHKLKEIIKEVRERVLNENKPLPSAREIIEILDKVDKENNNEDKDN